MISYHKYNALSVKSNVKGLEDYGDTVLNIKEHLSYTRDVEMLDIEYLDEDVYIRECDYCGKLVKGRVSHGGGVKQSRRVFTQRYVDADAEYPSTNDCCGNQDCITKKRELTTWLRHGVLSGFLMEETIEKKRLARVEAGLIPVSRQQRYISNLLNGDVNVYFKGIGYIDIIIEDEKIIIEYDGGGHYIGIHHGNYTYEEKIQQDYERDLKMRLLGYKIIRIHSENDYLPSDEVINAKINDIKKFFKMNNKEFFKWVIPNSKKDKRYGKLRSIKEEDL